MNETKLSVLEFLNNTTLEIWAHLMFCGINMRELLLHSIIKPQIIQSLISSHVIAELTNEVKIFKYHNIY